MQLWAHVSDMYITVMQKTNVNFVCFVTCRIQFDTTCRSTRISWNWLAGKTNRERSVSAADWWLFIAQIVFKPVRRTLKPKFHLARHVTSRHDTTRSTCRAHAFWLCRARRTAKLDTLVSTRSTRWTCRVVSRRDV